MPTLRTKDALDRRRFRHLSFQPGLHLFSKSRQPLSHQSASNCRQVALTGDDAVAGVPQQVLGHPSSATSSGAGGREAQAEAPPP